MSYNPDGGKKPSQHLTAAAQKVSALCQADQDTTEKQFAENQGTAVTGTPHFFTKQRPEMIEQDLPAQRCQGPGSPAGAHPPARPQCCSQPRAEKHRSQVWGSQENPLPAGVFTHHIFIPQSSFPLEPPVSLPVLSISCSHSLTLQHAQASFPNSGRAQIPAPTSPGITPGWAAGKRWASLIAKVAPRGVISKNRPGGGGAA